MYRNWKRNIAVLAVAAMLVNDSQMVRAAEISLEDTELMEPAEVGTQQTDGGTPDAKKTEGSDGKEDRLKINRFETLAMEDSYVEVTDEQMIAECEKEFPAELTAYAEGMEEALTLDVVWENTYVYDTDSAAVFYEYRPKWDEERYVLAGEVNEATDVPVITVALMEETKVFDDNEDPQYERATGIIGDETSGKKDFRLGSLADSTYIHNTRYTGCVVVDGIDVSKYQGYIDWAQVKQAGVDFAFIRVGYRGYESGSLSEDEYFRINIERATNAGIKVGVYIYSQAITNAEAVEEANYILNRISGYNITMPVVIDYEYAGTGKGRLYNANLSVDAATGICNSFCARVAEAGYTPMVYANKDMLEAHLNASAISSQYKIWLANYTTQTSYSGAYDFWQYSSSGSVNGIGGAVDCNFWYRPKSEVNGRTIADGTYTIATALNDNMVLSIEDGSAADGGNLALGSRTGSTGQTFTVKYMGDGKYAIMANCSGKMIDVAGGGSTQGTNVWQYQDNGLDTQRWYIQDAGNDFYYLESCVNGMYLDVENGVAAEGTNIQLWNYNRSSAQKFTFKKAGLNLASDGNWYYYTNGKIDESYTGMASNEYGWWYITNGTVDWNYTGMACNEYGWWYMRNGALDWSYTGMACNEYGWWYMRNGALDWSYTGMALNEYGWWYITNGALDLNYTGMALNEYGWWYMRNGALDLNYTGMACNEYGWWYMTNGALDWSYTGMACNEYGWWYMTNGALDWSYTGMALNEYGWWYMTNGALDWSYTGMALNEYGWWYITNGALDMTYTGPAYNEYGEWHFTNGILDQ